MARSAGAAAEPPRPGVKTGAAVRRALRERAEPGRKPETR